MPSDSLCDLLQFTISAAPHRDMIIILGDFNTWVGADPHQEKGIIGPYGLGVLNENDKRLLNFLGSKSAPQTNTWVQHKPKLDGALMETVPILTI